jgi:endonuclease/exonuclease/phosphatase family metal-dependent hydrolase
MRVIRVATYNIRHCEGTDGRTDPARTARIIAALKADVVSMQEIDRGWERSGRVDQVTELEAMTGMWVDFRPTVVREDGAEYGIALAAVEPLDTTFELLPRLGTEEPRGLITAEAHGITLLTTHLSRSRRTRAIQTEHLAEAASATSGPVIVLGDLNQPRRHLGPLHEAGLDEGAARLPTLPSTHPRRQMDYVLAGRGARVTKAWTPKTTASDHVPLVAVVEVP